MIERTIRADALKVRDVILGPEQEWPVHDVVSPRVARVVEAQLGIGGQLEWWSWWPDEPLLVRRST